MRLWTPLLNSKRSSICYSSTLGVLIFLFAFPFNASAKENETELFNRFFKKANEKFEAKYYLEAEDAYSGAIYAGLKIRSGNQPVQEICQSYLNLAKCQFATKRAALAEHTEEDALKKIDHKYADYLGPIAEELFNRYMDQRRWKDAVRIFFALYSDAAYNRTPSYMMSFIPGQVGIDDNELPLEKAQKWFQMKSAGYSSPDLYNEFCIACINADADDYVRDQCLKGNCVLHLMSIGKYAEALPYLQRHLNQHFWLGLSTVGYPKDTAQNLAICLQKTGRAELAHKVEAVIKARKNYLRAILTRTSVIW